MTLPKDPEKLAAYIEKQRENNRRQFSDPANIEKQRQKANEQFSDPAAREAAAEKQRELWADPIYRARMIESARKKPPFTEAHRKAIGDAHRGMKRPALTGQLISEAAKKRWANWSVEKRTEILHKVAVNNNKVSSLEVILRDLFDKLEITYEWCHKVPPYICDFYLPEYNLIVEADGEYWHDHNRMGILEAEIKRDAHIIAQGYLILHLTESQINVGAEDIVLGALEPAILRL